MRTNIHLFSGRSSDAFTRLDLLALVGAIFLLGALALPALATTVPSSRAAICKSNLQTLIRAWQLYADDNAGRLPFNFHGGSAVGGSGANQFGAAPWASGWLDWNIGTDITNSLLILDRKYAYIVPYLPPATKAHKCAEDTFLSAAQKAKGWSERVRTVVMNGTVGNGNAITGPWDPIYEHVKSIDQFRIPGPSKSMVFLEEHPESINDPFFFPPRATSFIDLPGNLHDNGMTVAFADGNVQLKPWQSRVRHVPVRFVGQFPSSTPPGDPDLSWLSFHSARRSESHY